MLNEKQKAGLWLGIAIAVAMGSYPPWKENGQDGNPAAYAPIYAPPARLAGRPALTVDLSRLLLQWSMVGFVIAGLMTTHNEAHRKAGSASAKTDVGKQASTPDAPVPEAPVSDTPVPDTPVKLSKLDSNLESNLPQSSAAKIISFPEKVTLGEVLIESQDDPDYWEAAGEARGTIEVPSHLRLQLEGNKSGPVNLSSLRSIDEDVFYSIDLSESEVKDEDLVELSAQKNLHELDLSHTRITDKGIQHLAALSCLQKLWLDQTKITDSALSTLKEMETLAKLSLTGTEVTESAIKKLRSEFPTQCEIILANGSKV